MSVILADKDVMLCIRPGEHGRCFFFIIHRFIQNASGIVDVLDI